MSILRTHDLTKSYGGRTVVRGVSLEVQSGEVVGLLGPNGAGKTTTFYMTVGLTVPDSGRVVPNESAAAPMWEAIIAGQSMRITGKASNHGGAVAEEPPAPSESPAPSPEPSTTATPPDETVLSEQISGIDLNQETCSG